MGATMGSFLSVKRFFSVLKGSVLKPEKNLVVVFQKRNTKFLSGSKE